MSPPENWRFEKTVIKPGAHALRSFGQYDLLEPLGRGGMGVVWKGRHRHLGQIVAIKFLASGVAVDPQALARFYAEMQAIGGVVHPHVVRALDAGEYDGQHLLVMEYVAGVALRELMHEPEPIEVGCEIIRQAALGLAAIHAAGMIHRDLKPGNLFLTDDGIVKILDLGLARSVVNENDQELTRSGYLLGTVDYMSPEQAEDPRAVDARADIYSLGCTLYCILAGTPPFKDAAPTLHGRLQALRENAPRPLSAQRDDVPPALDELILKLLAKQPGDRIQTAEELVQVLTPFAAGANLRAWRATFLSDQGSSESDSPAQAAGSSHAVMSASVETSQSLISPHISTRRDSRTSHRASPLNSAESHWSTRPVVRKVAMVGSLLLALGIAGFAISPTGLFRSALQNSPANASLPAPVSPPEAPGVVKPGVPTEPIPSPPLVQLRDFSHAPPRVWHKLGEERPVPVFWKPGEGLANWSWVEEQQQIHVMNDDLGLLGLGTIDSPDYALQIGIHQSRWSSGLGVFLGLQGWEPGDAPTPWRCLWLNIVEVRAADAAPQYRLDLTQIDATIDPNQRLRLTMGAFASTDISQPSGEATLEVAVSEGHLQRVRWNGESLRDFVFDVNQHSEPVNWQGGFGIMVNAGSATIRNSQLMRTEPLR